MQQIPRKETYAKEVWNRRETTVPKSSGTQEVHAHVLPSPHAHNDLHVQVKAMEVLSRGLKYQLIHQPRVALC